jgi:RNA polymerase II-associated factor 1
MSREEQDEREETLAEVNDPMYLMGRGDADADGELDEGGLNFGAVNAHGASTLSARSQETDIYS